MSAAYLLIGTFIFINIVAFSVTVYDKRISRKGADSDRIPEGVLFFLATVFGAIGVYVGMLVLRHKTRRWYFMIGIPLLILQNGAALYMLRQLLVP